jgi:hypothetical protein
MAERMDRRIINALAYRPQAAKSAARARRTKAMRRFIDR